MPLLHNNVSQSQVLERLCKLSAQVRIVAFNGHVAADCFCGQPDASAWESLVKAIDDRYQFDEGVIRFIEQAVEQALDAHAKRPSHSPEEETP